MIITIKLISAPLPIRPAIQDTTFVGSKRLKPTVAKNKQRAAFKIGLAVTDTVLDIAEILSLFFLYSSL